MIPQIHTRGMTPIEKNIAVVDEQGNEYEATYPKRAKGLVKNGRARFIAENKICLACPPDKNLEENNNMSDKCTTELEQQETRIEKGEAADKYTLAYALEQLEKLAASDSFFREAMEALKTATTTNTVTPCGGSADAIAKAVQNAIQAHETTNQKLVEFYSKMVDDLKPKVTDSKSEELSLKVDLVRKSFSEISSVISSAELNSEDKFAALGDITEKIANIIEQLVTAK